MQTHITNRNIAENWCVRFDINDYSPSLIAEAKTLFDKNLVIGKENTVTGESYILISYIPSDKYFNLTWCRVNFDKEDWKKSTLEEDCIFPDITIPNGTEFSSIYPTDEDDTCQGFVLYFSSKEHCVSTLLESLDTIEQFDRLNMDDLSTLMKENGVDIPNIGIVKKLFENEEFHYFYYSLE